MRVRLIGEGACLLAVDYTLHLIFISHIAIGKLVVINFHLWLIFVLSLINSALCVIECNFKLFWEYETGSYMIDHIHNSIVIGQPQLYDHPVDLPALFDQFGVIAQFFDLLEKNTALFKLLWLQQGY